MDQINVDLSKKPDEVSANIVSDIFEWKDDMSHPVNKNNFYFVSLINGKLVRSTNVFDVLGITLENKNNNKSIVGLFGIIKVHDDGTCIIGKKCTVVNGIATIGNQWIVTERISTDTIKILFR